MATPVFVPGYSQGATFTPDGGAQIVLNITKWSWEDTVKRLITTHSGSAGVQAAIAGVLDGQGTVEANFDSANIFHTNIHAGVKGTITYATGTTNPFSIHVLVEKVNWQSMVDGLATYNFSVSIDSSSGSYSRAS